MVVVDPEGEVASLSRQLTKKQRAHLKAALKGRDLSDLPDVETAREALAHAEPPDTRELDPECEDEDQDQGGGQARGETGGTDDGDPPADEPPQEDDPAAEDLGDRLAALQDHQLAELGRIYARLHERSAAMEAALAAQFDALLAERRARQTGLTQAMAQSTRVRGFWRWVTGQDRRDADELEMVETQIRSMEARVAENRAALEQSRQAEVAAISERHARERDALALSHRPASEQPVREAGPDDPWTPEPEGPQQSGP